MVAILIITIFTYFSVSVNCFALPFEGLWKLDIIHYNDFHARFEETSLDTSTCYFNNGSCLGGFPRLYYEIHELFKEKPDALLLNAGDSFQGTYWYTLLKWNVTQKFMNLLPHDAHAIGNHEFDDGPAGLAPYLSALKAPVLAANMDTSKEPSLQGLYKPYIVVKKGGRRVGIIGLITTTTKILSSAGNVEFTDPREAMRKYAKELTDQGVDIIMVLSHCGLDIDIELAKDYGENIDIIIGGHTHSLLWNGPSPSGEAVAGPYPIIVENNLQTKHKIVIVQASAFTKYMGNLTVYFDIFGKYVKWEGGAIFLNRSIPEVQSTLQCLRERHTSILRNFDIYNISRIYHPPIGVVPGWWITGPIFSFPRGETYSSANDCKFTADKDIKARLAPYAKLVHDAENVPIGETKTILKFEDCVFGECALGNLLVDSFNAYAKEKVQTNLNYLSFIQRGNIKSSLPQGQITKGMIFELLPYLDRVETFELPGKQVLLALERSVSDAWGFQPFKGPWVLQVSGLRVTYNVSQPEGQRIVSVFVGENGSVPLDSQKYYQVTAPAYLSDGGDGFSMFSTDKRNKQIIGRDQNVFEAYIAKHSPLDIKTDGRITIYEY